MCIFYRISHYYFPLGLGGVFSDVIIAIITFFFGIRNVEFDNLIDIYCIYLFFFLEPFYRKLFVMEIMKFGNG